MKANDYQVGGDHYSQAGRYQHWDFIEDHGIGYLEGYASKYLVRWDKKGTPVQDLEKSLHTMKKLHELATTRGRKNRAGLSMPAVETIGLFCSANKVKDDTTAHAIEVLYTWERPKDLVIAIVSIESLLREQPSQRLKRDYDKDGRLPRTEQERPYDYEYESKDEENSTNSGGGEAAEVRQTPRAAGTGPGKGSEDAQDNVSTGDSKGTRG